MEEETNARWTICAGNAPASVQRGIGSSSSGPTALGRAATPVTGGAGTAAPYCPPSAPRSVAAFLLRPSLRKLRVMAMYHTHSTTPENAETARPTFGS